MSKDFVLYKQGSSLDYATSIAATWIWAPALYVSSQMAHNFGLIGLLWFLVPNVLTLFVFGYFGKIVKSNIPDGISLQSVIEKASVDQSNIHTVISLTLLICSTVVQFIGIHTLLHSLLSIHKLTSAILSSLIAYAIVHKNGLKACIINDRFKYFIILGIGIYLTIHTCFVNPITSTTSLIREFDYKTFVDVTLSFGIITTIGLLSAPYVDNTFWQRLFSIDKNKVHKVFFLSGICFMLIPLLFGIIGLANQGIGDKTWQITSAFDYWYLQILLAVAICIAIISTVDSNLCAVSSLWYKQAKQVEMFYDIKDNLRLAMIVLLVISSVIFLTVDMTITQMFLLYGTIRTCAAVPTILIILNKYDKKRLFLATLFTVGVCCPGYVIASEYGYGFVFTILALLIPLFGISNIKK